MQAIFNRNMLKNHFAPLDFQGFLPVIYLLCLILKGFPVGKAPVHRGHFRIFALIVKSGAEVLQSHYLFVDLFAGFSKTGLICCGGFSKFSVAIRCSCRVHPAVEPLACDGRNNTVPLTGELLLSTQCLCLAVFRVANSQPKKNDKQTNAIFCFIYIYRV